MAHTSEIRTRFAPSPTGFLHVGGVRTLFFAYLLAKHHGGKFCLRIEDTDRDRLVHESVRAIVEDLAWLELDIDEGPSKEELKQGGYDWPEAKGFANPHGPYIQSLRKSRYEEIAEELVAKGFAYRCDCTPERLEAERNEQMARKQPPGYSGYCRTRNVSADSKHVIRLRIPENRTLAFNDLIRGEIRWDPIVLRDTVILKSDRFPTYHLAVVVDDHDMSITHVLRGEEWIATTPSHLLIYEALGWTPPLFAHLPSVLGADGKKLSKRHGATFVNAFREAGYLPEALRNFMLLYGWAVGDGEEQELFTMEEMIRRFTIERVNPSAGIFSYDKLNWMNGLYIRGLKPEELARRVRPFLEEAGLEVDEGKLTLIVPHIQERMVLLKDAVSLVDFLFQKKIDRDLKAVQALGPQAVTVLQNTLELLTGLASFEVKDIEQVLRELPATLSAQPKVVFMAIRIAVTGKKITPPLFESIHALGKDEALARIRDTLSQLSA